MAQVSLTLECIYQHHAGPVKTLTSNPYPEILSSQEFLFPESLRGAGIGAAGAAGYGAGAGSGAGGADSGDAGAGSGATGATGGGAGPGTIVENHWLRALLLKVWSLDQCGIHVRNVDCQPYPSHTRALEGTGLECSFLNLTTQWKHQESVFKYWCLEEECGGAHL